MIDILMIESSIMPKAKAGKARKLPWVTVASPSGGPPLPRRAAPLARRFQQVCATLIAEALSGEDLVQLEYGTLLALEMEPGVDQRRLADAMGIDPTNASLIVDRLQSKHLIQRKVSDTDRRARKLYLTSKGRAVWRRLNIKAHAANDQVLAPLDSRERDIFLDLLIRVIEGNREHAKPGAGRRKRSTPKSATGDGKGRSKQLS